MSEQQGQTADVNTLALLVEQAPDAVIYAGTDGVIQVWNAAAERVFGHKASEAIGQNLDMIIPEGYREAHWTGYDRALGDRVTKYVGQALATKSMNAAGDTIYVELSFAIVLGNDGEAIGALAHARDITERFQQERESRRKLRDLEKELAELKG
jgi:PAS domain S-box-containing protein